jgi:glycosyltransferase involved in cell wall biosynthesis
MTILFLDQYSDLGGAQRCLLDVLPEVRERGWRAHVAAPGNGPVLEAAERLGATAHSISCARYSLGRKTPADVLRFAWELPQLAEQISGLGKRTAPDLIYVNGPRLLPAAALSVKKIRVPLLFHCHSHLPQRSAAWLAGRALRSARATVAACCRFAVEPLTPYVEPHRLRIVYNGVNGGPARQFRCSAAPRRIGVIGRIAPEKGQAEFLRAARLLAGPLRRVRFLICGEPLFSDPVAQAYRRLLDELAVGLPVEFLGWRSDVERVLAELDLLVVPSVREPATTRVILEAYACGTPVVAFPSGGIPEIVFDGETGFLVDPPTPEALAAKIDWLLDRQPEELHRAGEAGRNLWRNRFTLERYRQELADFIGTAADPFWRERPVKLRIPAGPGREA